MNYTPKRQLGVGDLVISDRAKLLIKQALDNNRLSYGPLHKRLEEMFAKEHSVKYALFTNSGTSALQIALASLKNKHNWQNGDEVIVPAVTFVATANIILSLGMRPVFVDVEPDTFNINPELIEKSITTKTRCIIPVHLLGLPADMDPIMRIARKHNLKVIEDSCETMFATYKKKKVGSFGDIACFSTYVAHFIVTGVGGFAVTNDPQLYINMRSLINHGRDSIYLTIDDDRGVDGPRLKEIVAKRFKFIQVGYSYRCTELEAALGIAQLEEKDFIIRKRRENAHYLTENLKDLEEFLQLPGIPSDREHAFMLYGLVLKKGSKERLVNYLEENLIETRDLLPLVNQPIYRKLFGEDIEEHFSVAKYLNNQAFYIGCHQYFTKNDLRHIVKVFHGYFEKHMKPPNKINILGVGISAIRMDDAISKMEEWIEKNEPHYVCVCPVSTIMECQKDERLRDIVNSAGLATPDGMPLVWLSKLNGFPYTERVYGPDLMLAFCKVAEEKGYSNFFYGGANGVPEKLARNLRKRFPRLKVAGTYSPPFRPLTQKEDQVVIEMINKASPEVVWVGISTPKQDKWMAEHLGSVVAPVMVGVGAAFNFLSGEVRQAPRWMQRNGLEWVFRLLQEPARLWYRYLVYNPLFVLNLLLQWIGLRRFQI